LTIIVKNQSEAAEISSTLLGFREQRFVKERYSLTESSKVVQVHFLKGVFLQCSLCGCGVGFDETGKPFYEEFGFLCCINLLRKAKKGFTVISQEEVLLCSTCLIIVTRWGPRSIPALKVES